MRLPHRLLQRVHHAVVREALDSEDVGSPCLNGEHETGPGRFAVDQDRASAADTVLAAQMGAGEREILPEEVGQGAPGLDRALRVVSR